MSRLPPALLYLTIYNPSLQPSGPIVDNDEDAVEQAQILFYTAREHAVSRDKMLRQVGLAKALASFSDMFAAEDACESVHSQGRRMIMVSPELGYWIHACIELAKTQRVPPAPGKGKNGKDKGKVKAQEPAEVMFDYHDGSVSNSALRLHLLRAYETFALTHGSFASISSELGQQALELQLERFFTPWAWNWDIEQDTEFSGYLVTPPPEQPPVEGEAGIVRSGAAEALVSGTRGAFDATSSAFVAVGSAMNVRKWSWPGYLSFGKSSSRQTSAEPPQDAKGEGVKAKGDVSAAKDESEGGNASPRGSSPTPTMPEVKFDKESLFDAMSSLGIGPHGDEQQTEGKKQASRAESMNGEGEVRDSLSEDGPDESSSNGALGSSDARSKDVDSLGEVHEQDAVEVARSNATEPGLRPESEPESLPSLSRLRLHLPNPEAADSTTRRDVLYMTYNGLAFAFIVNPDAEFVEDDADRIRRIAFDLLIHAQSALDEGRAAEPSSPSYSATKILQPRDKFVVSKGRGEHLTSPAFTSRSEHLFAAQDLVSNADVFEVYSRTQGPQHWHLAKRERACMVYMEVMRKETSLTDVDNELLGLLRRYQDGA
ncbi:hypothetical protein K488DRAFT_70742 [Vararia minispora EC-137]|uniref:Uncharacterized protein n=1 Tax=Vararia minispora EC-137 TaxID=1314806 RepID=A0ACB8QKS6_9AGAM|nr:hypothetical protein K488DRAFT_70742 [Vararia minispora EC-137]